MHLIFIVVFKISYIVHAFLLINKKFLRDLNVIMSNEVQTIIKYIYVLKLLLQNTLTGCTGERRY